MKRLLFLFLFAPLVALAQIVTVGSPVILSGGSSGGGGAPSGPAGGVLGGTYPNPTFGTFSSATLAAALTDETGGTGVAVFNNTPTIISQVVSTGLTASGSAANDFSASTGPFLTSTGANTLGGAVTENDATTPSFTTAAGKTNTGFFQVNGKTSGSFKITTADATAQAVTLSPAAQTTGAATLTIPDMAGVSDTFEFLGKNQTITGIKTFSPTARSSGVAAYLTVNIPADTLQTAATESAGFISNTATRQWATSGTVALQRENFWAGPTYSSQNASQTFTDAFTGYMTPPIPGTNAIFTRGHTLGIVDSTSAASSITGGLIVATTLGTSATSVGIGGGNINMGGALTVGTTTVHTGSVAFNGGITASGATSNNFSGGSGTFLTSTGAVTIGTGAVSVTGAATLTGTNATTAVTVTQTARTSGVLPYFKINIPADTAQTAATESPGFVTATATRTWATTGTVALQRENFWAGPTYASAGASQTFTDAFTGYMTPPVVGANAIFTRGHTFGIVDSTSAASSVTGGFVVATTLGTTATSVGIGGGNVNAGGNLVAGGSLTTSQTAGIIGTNTNNNANAGSVGEYISSTIASGSAVTLTTATGANMTSVSLTAGDWDVSCDFHYNPGATTNITGGSSSISSTTATITSFGNGDGTVVTLVSPAVGAVIGQNFAQHVGPVRVSLSGTTTYFAVSNYNFTVSTLQVYGTLRARRIR